MPFNPKGTLELTGKERLVYAEPGIVVKTKPGILKTRRVFDNLPTSEKAPHFSPLYAKFMPKQKIEKIDETIHSEGQLTAFTVTKNGEQETILVKKELADPTEVIFRRFEYPSPELHGQMIVHPYLAQVALFERIGEKDPLMAEMGDEIKIIKNGYMYLNDLATNNENFEEYKEPLFSEVPKKTHVNQTYFGDCYLLSAIISILHRDGGAEFIQSMFYQIDDKNVVVRLYDPRTLEPVYLRVKYSRHTSREKMEIQHTQPWVHILEKAFAGAGFQHILDAKNTYATTITNQSFLSVYGAGGFPGPTMTILTGQPSTHLNLNKQKINNPFEAMDLITLSSVKQAQLSGGDAKQALEAVEDTSYAILMLSSKLDLVLEFGDYLKKFQEVDFALYSKWQKMCEATLATSNTLPEVEQYYTLFKNIAAFEKEHPEAPRFPSRVQGAFLEFVCNPYEENGKWYYPFPSKLATGRYTKDQMEIYDAIKTALENNQAVAATTSSAAKGIDGLRARHTYAVTEVRQESVEGKRLCFVRLRNPWNKVGRTYHFSKADNEGNVPAEENENIAEFDLELSEFYKFFGYADAVKVPAVARLTFASAFRQEIADLLLSLDKNEKIDPLLKHNKIAALTALKESINSNMDDSILLAKLGQWRSETSTYLKDGRKLTNYELMCVPDRKREKVAGKVKQGLAALTMSRSGLISSTLSAPVFAGPASQQTIDNLWSSLQPKQSPGLRG